MIEEREEKLVPLNAKVYTAKNIFVGGLNFYFEHKDVRVILSHGGTFDVLGFVHCVDVNRKEKELKKKMLSRFLKLSSDPVRTLLSTHGLVYHLTGNCGLYCM